MATKLIEMINRQAAVIDELAELNVDSALARLREARRILLVGTGTSQHAAELGAVLLTAAGCDARPVAASLLGVTVPAAEPGDALIVITHTARTAYAARCRVEALATGVPCLAVTGPGSGWPEAIETPVKEESETYTVSYLAALTVLARLADGLGAPDVGSAELRRAAAAVRAVVAEPGIDHIEVPARSLAVVGAGLASITAREGALKVREASGVLAEGFDAERLLHGYAVPYGESDGMVLLPTPDPDGLVAALGAAATAQGVDVSTVRVPDAGLSPVLAQVPLTAALQCLAARLAALRGSDPDVVIRGAWAQPRLWELGAPG